MSVQRSVAQLLGQIARQDVLRIGPEHFVGRAAALVHIAEQYGFEYAETVRTGQKKALVLVRMYRDARPEARAREAATIAAHPQAGNGGPVPGMRPGTLKPLPGAAEAVARTKDRIMFDTMTEASGRQQQMVVWGGVAFMVLLFLAVGQPLAALGGGAGLAALAAGAFRVGVVRRRRFTQRLTAAGFTAVRDGNGRTRFLRPGQQLPGHANPFAG